DGAGNGERAGNSGTTARDGAAGEAPRQLGADEGRGGAHLLQFSFPNVGDRPGGRSYCNTPAFLKSPALTKIRADGSTCLRKASVICSGVRAATLVSRDSSNFRVRSKRWRAARRPTSEPS